MNLANKITILRVLMIPIFMIILLSDLPWNNYIAAVIFIIASLTDTIDGYIARSKNQVTSFGKFIDPLADKLLVTTALICLIEMGKVPAWVVIIILSREFAITGFRTIAASEGVTIAASPLGKIKTITQLVAIISLLINNYPFRLINFPFDRIMLYISLIFTLLSGIDYLYRNKHVLKLGER
jgi:CDP-diacylglycerol--glycerol-3-phosphate 3-phosphatidyltransferase